MNQPELGLKVAELRRQKGLTQEQLAESCEVSTRTIQRIESGEADPRVYTLQRLSDALDFDFEIAGIENKNLWLSLLHLSSIFCIPIIPLLLWSWKKDQSQEINQQGRQVLNFQITMTLTLITAVFLLMLVPLTLPLLAQETAAAGQDGPIPMMLLVFCVPMPLILLGIFTTYQGVINAMRALSDRPIHYTLSIPFVK